MPEPTHLTMPGDREIHIRRLFHAPADLVFEAWTAPQHVRRWYGPRGSTMIVCDIDLRVGGRWRYVLQLSGGTRHGISGEYQEITRPGRLVHTEGYEGLPPGHDFLVVTTFEARDGHTEVSSLLQYRSMTDRDAHIASGMEPGLRETLDRFAHHLASLA